MGYVRTAGMSTAARRARRRTALVITGLLAVLLVALFFSLAFMQGWFGLGSDEDPDQIVATQEPTPAIDPADVSVIVFNGTGEPGLAGRAGEALTALGFSVDGIDNGSPVEGAGVLTHGPEGLENAEFLKEEIGQDLTLVEDGRSDTSVDLTLGPDWQDLEVGADDAEATEAPEPTS